LPRLSPRKRRRKVCGAFSKPSCTSTLQAISPLATQAASLRRASSPEVVAGDGAAQHDAGPSRDAPQHLVQDRAAHVVEVDVDAIGTQRGEAPAYVFGLVVDGRVEAGFGGEPAAFLRAAGDADHAAALEAGDLTGHRAGGARGSRNDHCLTRPGLPHVEHAEVGGEAGDPEHAERERWLHARGKLREAVAGERVLLPASHARHEVAGPEATRGRRAGSPRGGIRAPAPRSCRASRRRARSGACSPDALPSSRAWRARRPDTGCAAAPGSAPASGSPPRTTRSRTPSPCRPGAIAAASGGSPRSYAHLSSG